MSKALLGSVVTVLFLSVVGAQAQHPILKSPSVAKARACLDKLAADGKQAGIYTDRDGGQILLLNPTQPQLHPLLVKMAACLDDAFPDNEIVKHPATGTSSRIWYVQVDDQYAWCATNSLHNEIDDIDVLGGYGPRRAWYGVTFNCSISEKILGFHEP